MPLAAIFHLFSGGSLRPAGLWPPFRTQFPFAGWGGRAKGTKPEASIVGAKR